MFIFRKICGAILDLRSANQGSQIGDLRVENSPKCIKKYFDRKTYWLFSTHLLGKLSGAPAWRASIMFIMSAYDQKSRSVPVPHSEKSNKHKSIIIFWCWIYLDSDQPIKDLRSAIWESKIAQNVSKNGFQKIIFVIEISIFLLKQPSSAYPEIVCT